MEVPKRQRKKIADKDLTRRSSAETEGLDRSSAIGSSLPRVGLRWWPGVSSDALSHALSRRFPCSDFSAWCASCEKYAFSTVSK
jgi:hypothetical protein